jgi:hypothetical protein
MEWGQLTLAERRQQPGQLGETVFGILQVGGSYRAAHPWAYHTRLQSALDVISWWVGNQTGHDWWSHTRSLGGFYNLMLELGAGNIHSHLGHLVGVLALDSGMSPGEAKDFADATNDRLQKLEREHDIHCLRHDEVECELLA